MDKKFHQLAVEIAFNAMPAEYREKYMAGFSFEMLMDACDIPYVPMQFGENENLHLGHSYKLYLKGRDLHKIGSNVAMDEAVNYAKSVPELFKENKNVLVRYNIAKGTHYVIDIATFPHVCEATWDKYHSKFEDLASVWLESHKGLVEELTVNYKPDPMKSVSNRIRAMAEEAYFASLDFLPPLKRNTQLTDLQWATMCVKHVYSIMDWFATFERYL